MGLTKRGNVECTIPLMRTFLFFMGSALGSIAFQLSVALWPQYFRSYGWAIKYVWIAWLVVWVVWLAVHPTLLGKLWSRPILNSPLPAPAPGAQDSFNPTFAQTGPTVNVNVGTPLGTPAYQTGVEIEESKPNVVCLGDTTATRETASTAPQRKVPLSAWSCVSGTTQFMESK
jgi:hypothetical protein